MLTMYCPRVAPSALDGSARTPVAFPRPHQQFSAASYERREIDFRLTLPSSHEDDAKPVQAVLSLLLLWSSPPERRLEV